MNLIYYKFFFLFSLSTKSHRFLNLVVSLYFCFIEKIFKKIVVSSIVPMSLHQSKSVEVLSIVKAFRDVLLKLKG